MTALTPYRRVRIVRLRYPPEHYDGWRLNQRPPRVGEVGTLIDILRAPGLPDAYVVELSDADGATVWLGDFDAVELEAIDDAS